MYLYQGIFYSQCGKKLPKQYTIPRNHKGKEYKH